MADPDLASREETLRALEQRLERATRAAERLLAEAADDGQARAPGRETPPAGWRRRPDDEGIRSALLDPEDVERLLAVLATVLDRIPSELQRRLVAALRELLVALRALVDWCLDRAERRGAEPPEVQDIPIL